MNLFLKCIPYLQLKRESQRKVNTTFPLDVEPVNEFAICLQWNSSTQLNPNRIYGILHENKIVIGFISRIKCKIDLESLTETYVQPICAGDFVMANLQLESPESFIGYWYSDAFTTIKIVDLETELVVGHAMILYSLRKATNIKWQPLNVDRALRIRQLGQSPLTIWFTGLSGSGKSTLANALEKALVERGLHTYLLDGDNLRHGLNRDLGFTEVDRIENIRRVAEVAKLMNDAGLIVLASFIAPYHKDREQAKAIIGDSYVEVFVSTPLEECERRDVKGLYAKARSGVLPNFTGVTAPYEVPTNPMFIIDTSSIDLNDAVDLLVASLFDKGVGREVIGE